MRNTLCRLWKSCELHRYPQFFQTVFHSGVPGYQQRGQKDAAFSHIFYYLDDEECSVLDCS
jgi:hypothetical protein